MGFAETFASWNVKAYALLREYHRRDQARFQEPFVEPVFAEAVSALAQVINRLSETLLRSIPSEEYTKEVTGQAVDAKTGQTLDLFKRFAAFPATLRYYYSNDQSVILYSTDRWMERALSFGTRDLPRVRPIEFLVRKMRSRLDPSLVFTARDFRKFHEYKDTEWLRENLRVLSPFDYT